MPAQAAPGIAALGLRFAKDLTLKITFSRLTIHERTHIFHERAHG